MCIIVDANAAHDLSKRTADGKPVLRWLLGRKQSGLVIGGKLAEELVKGGLTETLAVLTRAGRLHRVDDAAIKENELKLNATKSCKSNDVHVVALALASKCTIVFTRDTLLHEDLKSNSISGRKISIYQNSNHCHLLSACHCI